MQTDITVQYLGQNKKNPNYGYIKTAEGDTYGCAAGALSQFSTGEVCTIQFHTNAKGYKELDGKISSKQPAKQNVRPATNPADSDRMATMGMVNQVLGAVFAGQALTDVLAYPPGAIAQLIDKLSDEVHRSKLHGKQVQHRDDMNDEIPFP